MTWFKNRRMALKLALAFGACVLLTVAVGLQAIQGMRAIKERTDRVALDARGRAAITDANLDVTRALAAVSQAVIDDNASDVQQRVAAVKEHREAYVAELATFEKSIETDDARQALAELRKTDAQLRTVQDEILGLAEQQKDDEARAKLNHAHVLVQSVDDQVDRIERTAERTMASAVAEIETAYAATIRMMLITIAFAVAAACLIAFVLTRLITSPIGDAVRVLQAVALGDFTQQLVLDTREELGDMARALNEAVLKVRTALDDVRAASDTVASAAQQLASSSEEISSGAQEQASSLEETAASLEEITATIKLNADNAQQASQLAGGARAAAENGGQVVNDAVTAMGAINASSKQIADIITAIDEIAFQTNLLALNAAVEAARAGEQGRGFAVVAAEVRNLAQRSASAAKEIKALIQDSVRKVDAGSELVNASGRTLAEIVTAVKRVTDIVAEIAAASREQAGGIEQVNKAVTQMDQVTQANASQTEEMSGIAESLAGEAGKLQTLILQFKLGDARPVAVASARVTATPRARTVAITSRPARPAMRPAKAPAAAAASAPQVDGALALSTEFQEF